MRCTQIKTPWTHTTRNHSRKQRSPILKLEFQLVYSMTSISMVASMRAAPVRHSKSFAIPYRIYTIRSVGRSFCKCSVVPFFPWNAIKLSLFRCFCCCLLGSRTTHISHVVHVHFIVWFDTESAHSANIQNECAPLLELYGAYVYIMHGLVSWFSYHLGEERERARERESEGARKRASERAFGMLCVVCYSRHYKRNAYSIFHSELVAIIAIAYKSYWNSCRLFFLIRSNVCTWLYAPNRCVLFVVFFGLCLSMFVLMRILLFLCSDSYIRNFSFIAFR